jgi:SRSO17 transposase
MIERAPDAGIPFTWVTADEAYGGNPALRKWLEEQAIPFVMAVACDARVARAAGRKRADELVVSRITLGGTIRG